MKSKDWHDAQLYFLPNEFVSAAFWNASRDSRVLIHQPFTPRWDRAWSRIANSRSKIFNTLFTRSVKRYQSFKEKGGLDYLKTLADKGADPNLILSVFIRYLWNERVGPYEHTSDLVKYYKEMLAAVRKVKDYYLANFKGPWEKLQSTEDPVEQNGCEMIIYLDGGVPKKEAEEVLRQIEEKLAKKLEDKDFRRPGLRRSPNDKVNRVLSSLHEHITQETGGPQWTAFLNLLVAAGAVRMMVKKRRTQGGVVTDSPDRRIYTHLRSFQKDHPVEARFIKSAFKKTSPPVN